jgi:hypothetical protein
LVAAEAGPYVTFSEDLAFAFVEQTDATATAEQAIAWLDARLGDEEHPLVPTMTDWSPALARVVSLEVWDDHAGTRVQRDAPGARVLWRVELGEALASDASDGPSEDHMEDLFVRLHEHGYLNEDELARARLLLVAMREQLAERTARQAARPPDAPRAYLSEGGGALIARLFLPFAWAVANAPDEDARPMREAVHDMQQARGRRRAPHRRAARRTRQRRPTPVRDPAAAARTRSARAQPFADQLVDPPQPVAL